MDPGSVLLIIQKYNDGEKLTEYCKRIASFLDKKDVDVHLVCFGEHEREERIENINLHEFSFKMHGDNYFSWSMLLQTRFMEKIEDIIEKENVRLIHANDWTAVPASLTASKLHDLPFILTYHSVENERGMHNPHSHQISDLEWEGVEEASYVIVHKQKTADAMEVYDLPENKVKLLADENWEEDIFEIYKKVLKVNENLENMEKEALDNENFNAYMGVPTK